MQGAVTEAGQQGRLAVVEHGWDGKQAKCQCQQVTRRAVNSMSVNTAETAAIEDRRAKAWELRVKGKTLREIAAELGVSHVTIFKDVNAVSEALNAETLETAAQHRSMQLQRLDKAIAVLMPMLDDPDRALEAMDRLDKIERRRAALLGLDAPAKSELTGKDGAPLQAGDVTPALAARLVREAFGEHAAKSDSSGAAQAGSGEVPDGAPGA